MTDQWHRIVMFQVPSDGLYFIQALTDIHGLKQARVRLRDDDGHVQTSGGSLYDFVALSADMNYAIETYGVTQGTWHMIRIDEVE